MKELYARVIGSPLSTLAGMVIAAIQLGLHTAFSTVDWGSTEKTVVTAITAAIPVVIGALMKQVPKGNPVIDAASQQISAALAQTLNDAATRATENAITEIQKINAKGDTTIVQLDPLRPRNQS